MGQWIWSLDIRWEWLNEHRESDNEFLVQLVNETKKAVYSYHRYLIESKNIFDKYEDFKNENGKDLKKMYDIYNQIADKMDSFIKTYGEIYDIDDMEFERIVFQ
jgi:hypothetical protein